MTRRNLSAICLCLFSGWFLLSCGLENVPFIDRVWDPMETEIFGARGIHLPDRSRAGFGSDESFSHFVIFYRLYASNQLPSHIDIGSRSQLAAINSHLDTDVFALRSWVDPTNNNVNTAGVQNFFMNTRGFFRLELEGTTPIGGRNGLLGQSSLGNILEINFDDVPGQPPHLLLRDRNGVLLRQYDLRRAGGGRDGFNFEPLPEFGGALPFLNHPDLRYQGNRTADINADMANWFPPLGAEETYVLMYIAAAGLSFDVPPRPVFSQPTYLGIFRLPNWQ